MKLISLILISVLLASCARPLSDQTLVVDHQLIVREISLDPSLTDCEGLKDSEIPDFTNITDAQVAVLLVSLDSKLNECASDMDAVLKIIEVHNHLIRALNVAIKK